VPIVYRVFWFLPDKAKSGPDKGLILRTQDRHKLEWRPPWGM
jgi:hypothetical protein